MRRGRAHKPPEQKVHKPRPVSEKKSKYRGIDNTKDLDNILGKTKLVQDLLGVTKEELSALYEQSMLYLQTNRIDDAVLAFAFLTKLNPYISDFWIGYGAANLLNGEYKKAFDAFTMALTMDPSRYECYAYAIDCCLEMHDKAQAQALLDQAISYARRHPARDESALILHEAPRIQRDINALKKN